MRTGRQRTRRATPDPAKVSGFWGDQEAAIREDEVQRACIQLLEAIPKPPSGFWDTAINPVPAKSRAVAGMSKAMGLRAGAPDLLIVFRGRAIFVEFKRPVGGYLSAEQKRVHTEITLAGGIVTVVRSLDEFEELLITLGILSRRTS